MMNFNEWLQGIGYEDAEDLRLKLASKGMQELDVEEAIIDCVDKYEEECFINKFEPQY